VTAPTIIKTGSGSSKTSGTTLAITLTTTSYALGDYVVCGFSMDPTTGAVSFAKTAGTAVIGSWVTLGDIPNGSGTSGVRTVLAYAKVTTAGTITTVTVTHPTATAKAGETFNVSGADGTTPIPSSVASTTASVADVAPVPTSGIDYAGLSFTGAELASTSALGTAVWTYQAAAGQQNFPNAVSADASSVGTTGSGGATNISVLYTVSTVTPMPAGTTRVQGTSPFAVTSALEAGVYALFQPPVGASPRNVHLSNAALQPAFTR
jgi:hypothetical protein